MNNITVEITDLTKKYAENVGNFSINIKLEKGKVLGILGPNGAGKSTLIRQIMGFISPDSGKISFDGLDPIKDHALLMDSVGYISGELNLYDHLIGKKYLKLTQDFKSNVNMEFYEKLLNYFELDASRKIKKMSKGMKQKIAIIAAVMNKPKYLILDEPSSGLDPIMQKRFIKLIKKLQKENGTTVIICSHIFEEIIEISDEIIFIKNGSIVSQFQTNEMNELLKLKTEFEKIYSDEIEL